MIINLLKMIDDSELGFLKSYLWDAGSMSYDLVLYPSYPHYPIMSLSALCSLSHFPRLDMQYSNDMSNVMFWSELWSLMPADAKFEI